MAAPIQKVAQLAYKTFSALTSNELSHEKLRNLSSLTSKIRAKDLNFDPNLVAEREVNNGIREAPVTYVHLWEDRTMCMGVFVLKRGARLPLHNHPNMFGVLKVIHGTVHMESFSLTNNETPVPENISKQLKPWQSSHIKHVKIESSSEVSVDSDCCVLTPQTGNIHEIRSVNGPAAFLDILAPPYDHETRSRVCHYYRKLQENEKSTDDMQWLIQVSQPPDYWCDTADYQGPPLLGDFT